MKLKWPINFIVVLIICLVAILGFVNQDSAIAAQNGSDKIEHGLLDQISANGSVDFILQFPTHADLSPAYSMDWEARGEFVYSTLQLTAEHSQANAKHILDAQGLSYKTFIATDVLYVFGGNLPRGNGVASSKELTAIEQLAALPEVSLIRATRTYSIDTGFDSKPFENIHWPGDLLAYQLLTTVVSPAAEAVDWGIMDTKADQFWDNFGAQGSGIVVASIDTGVQWDHPALEGSFKCSSNPTDPKCWLDPGNICPNGTPCDNNGHGTHTMGTMVGADDPSLPHIVGMAPEAKWIACKGCENNNCSEQSLLACGDWVLAPGGNPASRPDVVNNSWGGGSGEDWYQQTVKDWEAAGIFPAFSAGNGGTCSSLTSPGDYQESFASGAYDSSRNIAIFSSRGPSIFGDNPYTKPNISAPGVNIVSSYPTTMFPYTGWIGMSGTSMASPHTAGAVALLWSCNPSLKGNVDATFRLLQDKADTPGPAGDCGLPADGEGNYTYGYGYLDVLAAGQATCNMVIPPALHAYLSTNESKKISFVLSNPGSSTLTWSLQESPSDATWLTEDLKSGSVAPGGHTVISTIINAAGLPVDLYQNNLLIQSNDPYTPLITIPVTLRVGIPTYLPLTSEH